jgi:O-succinylbenzoic acid--CoA ligase
VGPLAEGLKAALPFAVSREVPESAMARVCSTDPTRFWSKLLGAIEIGRDTILMDPGWPESWTRHADSIASNLRPSTEARILIPTSGSTGLPKFCIHDTNTLGSAARAYARRFGNNGAIHSVNILPQHHVGGLMPVFRSAECGGKVHFADYRDHESLAAAPFPLEQASLSVVPTQLRRLLADPSAVAILRRFALIFVGGAACPPDLLDQARREGLQLAPCYGATETAAMVTAMEPADFLAGATGVGTPLPHVRIEIDADQRVLVRSPSLLRAYLPPVDGFIRDPFPSGDLGTIDKSNNLHILGRADRVIITGGEKVHPEQVEAAALATGLVTAARCEGVPDPDWGHQVELWVEANPWKPEVRNQLLQELRSRLPAFAVPKEIHAMDDFRVNRGQTSSLKDNL